MGEVKIVGRYTVRGAGETWRGTVKLGEWDQIVAMVFVPTVYLYKRPVEGEWEGSKALETLKESLGQVLFHFYPYTGRIHRGPDGILELCCENQGAEVIEAESSGDLADLGEELSSKWGPLIPSVDPMRTPLHDLPLISVQLTRFRCGSISLGLACNHGIADGMAAYHLITEWARLARGEPLRTPPIHDRTLLRAGEPPKGPGFTLVDPPVPEGPPPQMIAMGAMPPTAMTMLPLSKAQVDKLKGLANSDQTTTRPFTRYEVLTAHIWRCVCKVKGSSDDEWKVLGITLDARSRVTPPLPQNYFGNAVLMVGAGSKAGELLKNPLGFTCGRIRETIGKVGDEYVQADIDDLKRAGPKGPWRGIRNPLDLSLGQLDLGVISWLTLPLQLIDFGWGNYTQMSPGPTVMEGVTNLLPGKEPGAALVAICLKLQDVDSFKSYFYQYLDSASVALSCCTLCCIQ